MRLEGKVALVTGASSGIGRAIALRFAREGARVVINYLGGTVERDNEAREVTEAAGGDTAALAIPADVSQRAPVEAMVARAVERFARLDIAVNNAGIQVQRPFLEMTDQDWDRVLAVNLRGPFLVTQAAVRQMARQEPLSGCEARGKIVNISSTHEDIAFPEFTSYCASKGGLRMLCRNLAIELAPLRININNIAPGAIATPINQSVLEDPAASAAALTEIPWGRWGTSAEVASLAVWLASEESNYATGSTFYLDGGLSQQVTAY